MKLACLSIIPILASALVGCGQSGASGLPATPLFAGVEKTDYRDGTRLIQSRLQQRFPVGTSAADLAAFLTKQGLALEQSGDVASLKFGSSFCGSQVRVSWTTNGAGQIKEIDTLYGDTGCP